VVIADVITLLSRPVTSSSRPHLICDGKPLVACVRGDRRRDELKLKALLKQVSSLASTPSSLSHGGKWSMQGRTATSPNGRCIWILEVAAIAAGVTVSN